MQINDMSSWEIDKYNVNGSELSAPTYSYPNQNLYVIEPDMNTVNIARKKLDEILK